MKYRHCFCRGCSSSQTSNPDLKFFSFPKPLDSKLKWLEFADSDIKLPSKPFLCSLHFADSAFQTNLRIKLNRLALPTINPPPPRENNAPNPLLEEEKARILASHLSKPPSRKPRVYSYQKASGQMESKYGKRFKGVRDTDVNNENSINTSISAESSNNSITENNEEIENMKEENSDSGSFHFNDGNNEETTRMVISNPNGKKFESNIKSLCRLCFSEGQTMYPIFHNKDTENISGGDDIRREVMECIPVPIEDKVTLPDHICDKCYKQLLAWFKFREMCVSTQTILKQYVDNLSLPLEKEMNSNKSQSAVQPILNNKTWRVNHVITKKTFNKAPLITHARECESPVLLSIPEDYMDSANSLNNQDPLSNTIKIAMNSELFQECDTLDHSYTVLETHQNNIETLQDNLNKMEMLPQYVIMNDVYSNSCESVESSLNELSCYNNGSSEVNILKAFIDPRSSDILWHAEDKDSVLT